VSVELENEMRARIRSELRRSLGGADGTHITPEAAAAAGAAAPAFHCERTCKQVLSVHCLATNYKTALPADRANGVARESGYPFLPTLTHIFSVVLT
jgi:hypothetical protein